MVAWGRSYEGQTTPPALVNGELGTATAIAAGLDHACAIRSGNGGVVCWGIDLGATTPPALLDGTNGSAATIGAGLGYSCAIHAESRAVVCWGFDGSGRATPPASVDGSAGTASALAVGSSHSCAIRAGSGAVVCWGWDADFQTTPPSDVNGISGTASAIAAGALHSCAIQAGTGAVVCWGSDGYGRATPPAAVNGTAGTASAISLGLTHSCAIQAGSGAVVCWGSDGYGQATPPAAVDGRSGTAVAIALGGYHTCAIQAGTGAVVCWGEDFYGQATPPLSVNGSGGAATALAAGDSFTLAIRGAAPLRRGDLLVTDYEGGRVVRIDRNGTVETFSPPPGGTNHLSSPAGIVVVPDGDAFVADQFGGRLIRIDRRTGAQSVVHEPDLDPPGDSPPTSIGDAPWGLDLFEDAFGLKHFYVSAYDGLWIASESPFLDGFHGSLVDATQPQAQRGLAVRSDGAALDSVWVAAMEFGLWAWDASDQTGGVVLPPASDQWFTDVEFADGVPGAVMFTRAEVGSYGCRAGTGGVFLGGFGVAVVSQGGLFRCPSSLVWVPERGEVYVLDVADPLDGDGGRIVKLRSSGPAWDTTWEQSLFVDTAALGVWIPGDIAYVPEPGSTAMGWFVLAALVVAERFSLVSRGLRIARHERDGVPLASSSKRRASPGRRAAS